MQDKDLIKQLKMLKQVKPADSWAFLAKQELLGAEAHLHWFEAHRQAFVSGTAAGVALMALTVFGWQFFNATEVIEPAQYQALTASLQDLENNLAQTSAALRNVQNAQEVLVVKEIIDSTIEQSEKVLANAKEKSAKLKPAEPSEAEVLSALVGAESALSAMKETNLQMQKEIVEQELAELEGAVLTEEQRELFEQAKTFLAQSSYPQAIEKIIELSQTR